MDFQIHVLRTLSSIGKTNKKNFEHVIAGWVE